MSKQINTVIILRNDATTDWADSQVILESGELGVGYLTREDGTIAVIVKAGDGSNKWADLPQVEGVFEEDQILTYNFGRHTTKNGYVNAGGKGMTTSEWLMDALSEIKEPSITQPSVTFSAGATIADKEIGSYITALTWAGGFSGGSYQYGSTADANSTHTGLKASDVSWEVKRGETSIGTTEDGSYTLTSPIQVTSVSNTTYATLTATATLDAKNARTPLNNVGTETSGKITATSAKSPWTPTADVKVTGYYKPFWGVIASPSEGTLKAPTDYTSSDVRGLTGKGSSTKGFPTALTVAAGSQQVMFFAKAGTYTSVTATDNKAMNAPVNFTKVANAVKVKGNNEYAPEGSDGFDYDLWYVDWGAGIDSLKQLTLKWA